MIRILLMGLWVCAVTAGASYVVAYLNASGAMHAPKEDYLDGIEYQKTRPLNVPMVENGTVQGYIVARFVYTVEARVLRQLSVPPEPFIIDEAFRKIYSDERLDFRKLSRYDLSALALTIKDRVNGRMQANIVQDVMIDEFNYVSKEQIRQ